MVEIRSGIDFNKNISYFHTVVSKCFSDSVSPQSNVFLSLQNFCMNAIFQKVFLLTAVSVLGNHSGTENGC